MGGNIDHWSFHRGLMLGLRTARIIAAEHPADVVASIDRSLDDLKEAMERIYPGMSRAMVDGDIFLPMPLMTEADIHGQSPAPVLTQGGGDG